MSTEDNTKDIEAKPAMSFLDLLQQPSIYDLLSSVEVTPEEVEAFQKAMQEDSNVKPFVKFVDMNNNPVDKDYNKPKSSVVIGIDVSF